MYKTHKYYLLLSKTILRTTFIHWSMSSTVCLKKTGPLQLICLTRTLALARGRASIISVAFDKSDGLLMIVHCGYWSTRLSRHVWTTATVCLRTAARPFVNGCNEFRTAPLAWSVRNQPSATLHHCCTRYTVCRLPDA